MQHWPTLTPETGFKVLSDTGRSQFATVALEPQQKHGSAETINQDADQWLYVISGSGRAVVGEDAVELGPGALVLIEAGEPHEIRNLGDTMLEAISICAPPEHQEAQR